MNTEQQHSRTQPVLMSKTTLNNYIQIHTQQLCPEPLTGTTPNNGIEEHTQKL